MALPEEVMGKIVIVGIAVDVAVGTVGGVSVAGGVLPVVPSKPLVVGDGAAVVVFA